MDILRPPDSVSAFGAEGALALDEVGLAVTTTLIDDCVRIELTAAVPVSRLRLRWRGDLSGVTGYLEDAWERSYGDLYWRPEQPERVMPWSFLADSADHTDGYGVRIGPGALCQWTADAGGITLWADVRCGGSPVILGGRTLHVADVVAVQGQDGENAFAVQRRLCAAMADRAPWPARLPRHPVYGSNDWHYALGGSDARSILELAAFTSACAPDQNNRPYVMVDDGWSSGGLGMGPWVGNGRYGNMAKLAIRLRENGTRPGLWYRPLTPLPEHRNRYRLGRGGGAVLDPTHPEVADSIREQLHRFTGWGYELIKHDFTVWDLLGRWGFQMGGTITEDGWAFHDRTRTTAEVFTGLYTLLRQAAGPASVMGCNALGHLVAGHAELQRIGDDASGLSWNRTRRMAINALAFRGAQHGALYAIDADVAPITPQVPYRSALQWLHLLAASGTPAFVSVHPDSRREVASALRDAFTLAAHEQPLAQPLDWHTSTTPTRWRFGDRDQRYDWSEPEGAWPFGD